MKRILRVLAMTFALTLTVAAIAQEAPMPKTVTAQIRISDQKANVALEIFATHDKDVKRLQKEFDQQLADWKAGNISSKKLALDKAVELMPALRRHAIAIAKNRKQFANSLMLRNEALVQFGKDNNRIAEIQGNLASKETHPIFKKKREEWAQTLKKLSARAFAKAAAYTKDLAEIEEQLIYVDKSIKFLDDLNTLLPTYAKAIGHIQSADAHRLQLRAYIENFEKSLDSLKALTDRVLQDPPENPAPMSTPKAAPMGLRIPAFQVSELYDQNPKFAKISGSGIPRVAGATLQLYRDGRRLGPVTVHSSRANYSWVYSSTSPIRIGDTVRLSVDSAR